MGEEKKAVKYVINLVTDEDISRVTEFVTTHFVDEPLITSANNDLCSSCSQFGQWCAKTISEGVSLMAVSSTGDLLGVSINGILTRGTLPVGDNDVDWHCDHPFCHKIRNLLGRASIESDVFSRYPEVDRVLEIRIGVVDPAFRRQAISTELRRKTIALAETRGIPLVKTDCTSAFSARAVAGLGFSCVFSLRYSDHLGPDGRPVFAPAPPHDRIQTYVYHVGAQQPTD